MVAFVKKILDRPAAVLLALFAVIVGFFWYSFYYRPRSILNSSVIELTNARFEVARTIRHDPLRPDQPAWFEEFDQAPLIVRHRSLPSVHLGQHSNSLSAIAPYILEFRCESVSVDDEDAQILSELSIVQVLSCDFSDMSNVGASRMNFPHLQILYFSAPEVTDDGMKWLAECNDLVEVRLSGTGITESTVALLNPFSLHHLKLDDTQVSDAIVAQLSGMPNLISISLAGTRLSDGAASKWSDAREHKSLTTIDLAYTDIGDNTVKALAEYRSLQRVRLTGCDVTDEAIEMLQDRGIDVNIAY